MGVIETIQELTGCSYVLLTNRCNTAIDLGLLNAKDLGHTSVFIPDQGGWIHYQDMPPKMGLTVIPIKTHDGVIEHIPSKTGCLIYCNPAGYFAEQPTQQ